MKLSFTQDEITTQYILPERIVLSEVAQNAEILLDEHPRQAVLGDAPICTLQNGGNGWFEWTEGYKTGM